MHESSDSEADSVNPRVDHESRRLVLKQASPDQVQQLADELGSPRRYDQPADLPRRIREIAWATGPAISLHYLEDPVSQQSFVRAFGADRQIVEALTMLAEQRLNTWRLDELLTAIDNPKKPLTLALGVIRAGLGSPGEFDEGFFRRIKAAMSHPDTQVREAAFFATAFPAWPQYLLLLEEAARNDRDEERRNDARMLADASGEGARNDPGETES